MVQAFVNIFKAGFDAFDRHFTDWLYGDWNEEKFNQYEVLDHIPGMHEYMEYKLDHRKTQEYFNRYDMDYTDVHDPRKLYEHGSAGSYFTYGLDRVSDNFKRLYR